MENPSTSSMVLSVESLNLSGPSVNTNVGPPQTSANLQSSRTSSDGPVAILWDIENCPIPSDVRPEDVAGNIRMALRVHPIIKGAVTLFSAYGDFNAFPRRLREGCQRTGVKLVDVPNGRKDAADKAILVDMFLFALDNTPPSSILLISGDVDFAPALHILGQRGYTVILVIPAGVGVSSALSNAGRFVWDWPSVARGEGFVPPKTLVSRGGSFEVTGYLMGTQMNENNTNNLECQNDEEAIVYQGVSQCDYTSRTNFNQVYSYSRDTRTAQSLTEYNNFISPCFPSSRSLSLPSGLSEASEGQDPIMWVQPGDLNGLKCQIVKLIELSGGSLPLARLPAEYHKLYQRPLYMQEYGVPKLVNLLKKMSDTMAVEGKGNNKYVYLYNPIDRRDKSCNTTPTSKKDRKRKGQQEENNDNSDESPSDEYEERLEQFRHEMQDLLVSCSWKIPLGSFEEVYLQRYKKSLDYRGFGVDDLEELINKVGDVMVDQEDGGRKKFIVPTS